MMKRNWFIILLFLMNNAFSQPLITKVIDLKYVPANKVIKLIQPLLQQGEQVTGSGQTLIVKVTPDTLTTLRTVLHEIDVPPVTFTIKIYQGSPNWLNEQNNHDVIYSTQPLGQVPRNQSINVLNGASAFVATGLDMPIVSAVEGGFYPAVILQRYNVHSGFLVKPLLQGSQVKLIIQRVREQQQGLSGQQFANQQINTTIMAPLNQWVALGSTDNAQNADKSSRIYSAGRTF
ncbi:MAG: type II/III secretion system protein [bacterium]|nr:type II/III secretion system protein [bacterium]